MTEKEER